MKTFRRIAIVYTVFMLATLAVILWFVHGLTIKAGNVASYDATELAIYRQIWEQVKEGYQQNQRETMGFACAVWGVALLVGYAFLGFVYLYMLKPLKEMEAFAEEIAKGNLDVPLPMRRFSVFESFTESFDLMREELAAAKEREREAEKAKREMVAELSHDLKTPVATIQATCEVMDLKYTMKLEAAEREL
ncbi:MAG: HAMP domain-containing histidine kinase, partial [Lachnospiraceae bacterium]|nr:HAMP domain-containing histidine kinase [Lachnospiraceae bacterium]